MRKVCISKAEDMPSATSPHFSAISSYSYRLTSLGLFPTNRVHISTRFPVTPFYLSRGVDKGETSGLHLTALVV